MSLHLIAEDNTPDEPVGVNHLRSCAGCAAHILVGWPGDAHAWCHRCRPKHVQPHATWAAGLSVGSTVYVQPDVGGQFARSAWLIRQRSGDDVTLSVLGLPHRVVTTTIGQLSQGRVA